MACFLFAPPVMSLASNLRRCAVATAATISLCLLPVRAASSLTPPAIAATHPHPHPPPDRPIVVFDKDYSTSGLQIWHLDSAPAQPPPTPTPTPPPAPPSVSASRPALPPGPLLESELRVMVRLLVALVVGGVIGMERRAANSLAGVRTFSLVSLGAAVFMSTTLLAFPNSDPTRVAAAISSSVGFLGAGVMQKNSKHSRGLTTASSVWMAAGLGIAAASGMFLLSFTGAISTVLIARYARFDSSLHLIRGNPVATMEQGVDEDDDDDDLTTRRGVQYENRDRFAAPNGNGFGEQEMFQLQALVDYDPSSSERVSEFDEEGGMENNKPPSS